MVVCLGFTIFICLPKSQSKFYFEGPLLPFDILLTIIVTLHEKTKICVIVLYLNLYSY